jgi:hypothetical protein
MNLLALLIALSPILFGLAGVLGMAVSSIDPPRWRFGRIRYHRRRWGE